MQDTSVQPVAPVFSVEVPAIGMERNEIVMTYSGRAVDNPQSDGQTEASRT